MKNIIIINGAMGLIGSSIFSYFVEKGENIVWGISRKGLYFEKFLDSEGKIHQKNLVFSLVDYQNRNYEIDIENFIDTLPDLPIIFIHTMGQFMTEISNEGKVIISDDIDGDGINDNIKLLTYEVPISFAKRLATRNNMITFIQLGSLSDKYNLSIHNSWLRSINLLKDDLKNICKDFTNFNSMILNVSSVLIPKEFIDRPFVSIQTDADMRYWLSTTDIAHFIDNYIKSPKFGFIEEELYKNWPSITPNHFHLDSYRIRRVKELYRDITDRYTNISNLKNKDSISYTFKNIFQMDRFRGELNMFLFDKIYSRQKPIIFYNSHFWSFVLRNKAENEIFSQFYNNNDTVFLICGSDTYLDKVTLDQGFKKYRSGFIISNLSKFENNYSFNVIDDFIVEVYLDKSISNQIDDFYKYNKEINSDNIKQLKNIISTIGENELIISRNKEKAENLRTQLLKDSEILNDF